MADVTVKGNVTVFGANGDVAFTGVASADMVSMAFSDNFTATEQANSEGNVSGVVASDQRYDFSLTFYPIPSAQSDAGFKAIDLPGILNTVAVTQKTATVASGNLPSQVVRNFHYAGGGRMDFTNNGLMTMTLPLRRWAGLTPA